MINNKKQDALSNKFIQKFLKNEFNASLTNKYKVAEIAPSLAYYLKTFSNINKFLDYICLILKHIFNENIIFIIPLNDEGVIWHQNVKIAAKNDFLNIGVEINSFFNQYNFSKNFKVKEILSFENALKKKV